MSELAKRKEEKTEVPVTRRSPFGRLEDEFDRFFDFLPATWPRLGWRGQLANVRMPKVDVIDETDMVRVNVEAPGVKKEDLDVSVTDNTVTIKGKTSRREETKEAEYYRCEIEQGSFSRTIGLPAEVDGNKVKAKFEDGLLELTMPKLEHSKRRAIKID
jgi:HSP20 family protein